MLHLLWLPGEVGRNVNKGVVKGAGRCDWIKLKVVEMLENNVMDMEIGGVKGKSEENFGKSNMWKYPPLPNPLHDQIGRSRSCGSL